MLGDRLAVHANAGVSVVPHTQGAVLDDYWGGASAVFALSSSTYAVVEWLAGSDQTLDGRRSERDFTSRIAPGARYAISLAGGQLVIGAAAPAGTTSEIPRLGRVPVPLVRAASVGIGTELARFPLSVRLHF
ncbi:MAG TPA: hypothetical protein VMS55_18365 [Myxococcota bacterium]|nr:hypothetical protein [Myxococcota bacterium]